MNFVFYGEVVVVWITAKQMPTIVDKRDVCFHSLKRNNDTSNENKIAIFMAFSCPFI